MVIHKTPAQHCQPPTSFSQRSTKHPHTTCPPSAMFSQSSANHPRNSACHHFPIHLFRTPTRRIPCTSTMIFLFVLSQCRDDWHHVKELFDVSAECTALTRFLRGRVRNPNILARWTSSTITTIIHSVSFIFSFPPWRTLTQPEHDDWRERTITREAATIELVAFDSVRRFWVAA